MAPVKRKGNAAEEAAARQPQKRVRVGAEGNTDQKKQKTKPPNEKSKSSSSNGPKPSELTVLRDEEAAFPRGGASILTPLERKQIQLEATKDVLFEQKGSKKPGDDVEDEEDRDVEMDGAEGTVPTTKKPRKRKTKSKKDEGREDSGRHGPRVEGLSFKVCRIFVFSCRIGQLTDVAHCPGVYDLGSSLEHQCPRHRPFPAQ